MGACVRTYVCREGSVCAGTRSAVIYAPSMRAYKCSLVDIISMRVYFHMSACTHLQRSVCVAVRVGVVRI